MGRRFFEVQNRTIIYFRNRFFINFTFVFDCLTFLIVEKLNNLIHCRDWLDVLCILEVEKGCFEVVDPAMTYFTMMSGKHDSFFLGL